MEVKTKQLYFCILLSALSLKTDASPLTENELDPPPSNTSLRSECVVKLDEVPNIEYAMHGRFLFYCWFVGDLRIYKH